MSNSPGLIIAGRRVPVPGLDLKTYLDDPSIPRATDGSPRDPARVSAIILHTTRGAKGGRLVAGSRASTEAEAKARYQASTSRDVSWHFTVDTDGTVVQSADAASWLAWHATHANGYSVGIEIVQPSASPDLYQAQAAAVVTLVSALADAMGIPKVTPVDGAGKPVHVPVPDWQEASEGGRQLGFNGVAGHRNTTRNRGYGDPSDIPFLALLANGFRGVPAASMTRAAGTAPARVPATPLTHSPVIDVAAINAALPAVTSQRGVTTPDRPPTPPAIVGGGGGQTGSSSGGALLVVGLAALVATGILWWAKR
jgi:hypothetical protein